MNIVPGDAPETNAYGSYRENILLSRSVDLTLPAIAVYYGW